MAGDKTLAFEITADSTNVEKGFKQTSEAARATVASVEKSFAGLGAIFGKVTSSLSAMTAVLAGGEAFHSAIDATKQWGAEQGSLAKQLQISTEKAAAYQIALAESGLSGEVLVSASDKMTKQLTKNEAAFHTIGVATRNANGSYRSTGEIMPEVIDHLKGLHNVTEQNTQGMALFGKSWTELRGVMMISAAQLEAAQQKARDLNLVVDPTQIKAYKTAMADMGLIVKSLQVQVGTMLLPLLTKLGAWMGETGPYVAGAFSVALRGIGEIAAFVYRAIEAVVEIFAGLANVLMEFIQGNYKAAWNMAVDAADQAGDKIKKIFTGIGEVWNTQTKIRGGLGEQGEHTDLTEKAPKDKHDPGRTAQWEAELSEFKLVQTEKANAEGRFWEMSKADERKFWQDKQALTVAGTNENTSVRKKTAELGLAINKDEFERQLQVLKSQEEAFKNNIAAKVELAEQEARLIAEKYGRESKEFAKVQGEIVKLKREVVAQQVELEVVKQDGLRQLRLGEITLAQETAREQYALGLTTNQQLLQLERQYENERMAIALEAQNARIAAMSADPEHSPVALQREKQQLLEIQREYALNVQKINHQITLESTLNIRSMTSSIEDAFAQMFTVLVTWQQTWAQAARQTFNAVAQASTQMIAKMLVDKGAAWLRESAMYQGFLGAKNASEKTSALQTMGTKDVESDAVVGANAAEGASGAASAMASIPYVGPILAIAAFASIMALILGAKSAKSAAGGYDIPAGINPMVQAHAEEMILPAKHADVIRELADGGGVAGGGDVHLHVHAVDGASVKRLFMDNGAHLVSALNAQRRSFNPGAR